MAASMQYHISQNQIATDAVCEAPQLLRRGTYLDRKVRMKALLEQQGLASALEELPAATIAAYDNVIQKKAFSALILCLGDRVLWEITKETTSRIQVIFDM
ncbi:hypothetical protein Tco_0462019 [Tanacetum coccineum]